MAKKAPSKHSRAARRATSPGIDTDKSLKQLQPPASTDYRPSVLGIHQAAGVTKKTKQGRKAVLSSKARRRQERGLDRAAAIGDRTAQKVQRSKSQARVVDYRRKAWDEINNRIDTDVGATTAKRGGAWAVLGQEGEDEADSGDEVVRRFYEDLDEEMEGAGEKGETAETVETVETVLSGMAVVEEDVAVTVPLPMAADDDIL